jgi:uncharacterized protein (UPF0147 family)
MSKIELLETVDGLVAIIERISHDPGLPDEAKKYLLEAASELCQVSIIVFTKG